jgi:hypothetical protein
MDERNALAGIIARIARAVRRMLFRAPRPEAMATPPASDESPGGDDMASSGVLRRPPDNPGSGSVALIEPTDGETGFEEHDPYTRSS